ncbi:unnamed protein product, partial [Didymodactylos carnosus]
NAVRGFPRFPICILIVRTTPGHQLLRDSVVLGLVGGNDRIDRTALIATIGQIVPVSEIDSIGNLGNFSEWFVMLKTTAAREKVLAFSELKVGDQTFIVGEPYQNVKTIRILNIPPTVPDDEIRVIASKWGGKVISIETERLPRPFQWIKTFVRRIRIRFSSRQDEENVPVTIKISDILVPVHLEGRQKVCYRCKQIGHIKAECTVLKCQKCHVLGHDNPDCQQKRSYASAAISTPLYPESSKTAVSQGTSRQTVTPRTSTPISSLPQVQVRVYHKCQQPGHLRKDCPTRNGHVDHQVFQNKHLCVEVDTIGNKEIIRQDTPASVTLNSEKTIVESGDDNHLDSP